MTEVVFVRTPTHSGGTKGQIPAGRRIGGLVGRQRFSYSSAAPFRLLTSPLFVTVMRVNMRLGWVSVPGLGSLANHDYVS